MEKQSRLLAVHDISCVGRCSLTVALPIISSAGIECSVIPTAVLSTHTGGFQGYTFRDLTEDILPISEHWKSLGLEFDAIYTGFLGSKEQVGIVKNVINSINGKPTIIVDPAMADNGKLYPIFDDEYVKSMSSLCAMADIIVPNITEACFMLGRKYEEGPYTEEWIKELMKSLSSMGSKNVVLTGVYFENGRLGASTYSSSSNNYSFYFRDSVPGYYHGTGDVFGSVLASSIVNGFSLEQSAIMAVDFTVDSILRTFNAGTDVKYGVDFEHGLMDFSQKVRRC